MSSGDLDLRRSSLLRGDSLLGDLIRSRLSSSRLGEYLLAGDRGRIGLRARGGVLPRGDLTRRGLLALSRALQFDISLGGVRSLALYGGVLLLLLGDLGR